MEVSGSPGGSGLAQTHFCHLLLVKTSHQPALSEGEKVDPDFHHEEGQACSYRAGRPASTGSEYLASSPVRARGHQVGVVGR